MPEAARRSGRNPETIRRWIRSGRLRSQKAGTQHLIDEQEFDALLDDGTTTPLPDWLAYRPDGRPQPDWVRILRRQRDAH